ncbi:MAG: hypothetical protein ACYCPT_07075 [Acidimicrobiales bacterium]
MTAHFTEDQRSLAPRRLRANGASLRDICKQISCGRPSHIQVVLKGQSRVGRSNPWVPRSGADLLTAPIPPRGTPDRSRLMPLRAVAIALQLIVRLFVGWLTPDQLLHAHARIALLT